MTARWITHVTLNTGHTRRSMAGEVSAKAITYTRELIDRALSADAEIPMRPPPLQHYRLSAAATGPALALTVHAPLGPHLAGAVHNGAARPLITLAVAAKWAGGPKLWDKMIDAAGAARALSATRPQAPWAAVLLWPAIAQHEDATRWLGDFERTAAWAWVAG